MAMTQRKAMFTELAKAHTGLSAYQVMIAIEQYEYYVTQQMVWVRMSQEIAENKVALEKTNCNNCGSKIGMYSLTDKGRIQAARESS